MDAEWVTASFGGFLLGASLTMIGVLENGVSFFATNNASPRTYGIFLLIIGFLNVAYSFHLTVKNKL